MDSVNPEFPALLIHEDGSIGVLRSIDDWKFDVDQWFWSEPGEYLIDSFGRKFVQDGERAIDYRPVDVPNWKFESSLCEDQVNLIAATKLGTNPDNGDPPRNDEIDIRELIQQLMEAEG